MEADTFLGQAYYNEVINRDFKREKRYIKFAYEDKRSVNVPNADYSADHYIEFYCWRDNFGDITEVTSAYLHHWKYDKKRMIKFNNDWLEYME